MDGQTHSTEQQPRGCGCPVTGGDVPVQRHAPDTCVRLLQARARARFFLDLASLANRGHSACVVEGRALARGDATTAAVHHAEADLRLNDLMAELRRLA